MDSREFNYPAVAVSQVSMVNFRPSFAAITGYEWNSFNKQVAFRGDGLLIWIRFYFTEELCQCCRVLILDWNTNKILLNFRFIK